MKAHLFESLRPFALLCTALRAFLLIAAFAGPVTAQDSLFSSEAPLDPRAAFALSVSPQPDGSRLLRWEIADGYYLYSDYLSVETASGVSIPLES